MSGKGCPFHLSHDIQKPFYSAFNVRVGGRPPTTPSPVLPPGSGSVVGWLHAPSGQCIGLGDEHWPGQVGRGRGQPRHKPTLPRWLEDRGAGGHWSQPRVRCVPVGYPPQQPYHPAVGVILGTPQPHTRTKGSRRSHLWPLGGGWFQGSLLLPPGSPLEAVGA